MVLTCWWLLYCPATTWNSSANSNLWNTSKDNTRMNRWLRLNLRPPVPYAVALTSRPHRWYIWYCSVCAMLSMTFCITSYAIPIFTQGSQYWKFHNLQLIYGPKNISEGFDGIPSFIDTSFVWSGNGKTYFVKGNTLRYLALLIPPSS